MKWLIMKWIFLLKSEDKTWKRSAYAADIFILFYNMNKWRIKEQPSPFIICSAMHAPRLQWLFKLKKKKVHKIRKLSVTGEVTIEYIFMGMVYSELMIVNQTNTMTLRINKIWKWEHPNKGMLFLECNLFWKVIAQEALHKLYFTHDKIALGFSVSEATVRR